MTERKSYREQLLDPRWQKRRLEILNRSDFHCEECGVSTKTLHVHHRIYRKGALPWEYSDEDLVALCHECHETHTRRRAYLNEVLASMDSSEIEIMIGFAEGWVTLSSFVADKDTSKISRELSSEPYACGYVAALRCLAVAPPAAGTTLSADDIRRLASRPQR